MAPLANTENSALRSINNGESSWTSYSPALAAILTAVICVSVWLIVIACGCGKNESKKSDKKIGKKKGSDGEGENEAGSGEEGGGEEGGEDAEEEPAADGTTKKGSPKSTTKKGRKGKKSTKKSKKKSPAPPVEESGVEQSNVKPGMMSKTTAPNVETEVNHVPGSAKKPKKGKKGVPKRGDPTYKTMFQADTQIFDKKGKKAQEDGCYILMDGPGGQTRVPCGDVPAGTVVDKTQVPAGTMVDKTQVPQGTMVNTRVPGGTMMKTQQVSNKAFGKTTLPQDTLAKARTEIFDKATQKPTTERSEK